MVNLWLNGLLLVDSWLIDGWLRVNDVNENDSGLVANFNDYQPLSD